MYFAMIKGNGSMTPVLRDDDSGAVAQWHSLDTARKVCLAMPISRARDIYIFTTDDPVDVV